MIKFSAKPIILKLLFSHVLYNMILAVLFKQVKIVIKWIYKYLYFQQQTIQMKPKTVKKTEGKAKKDKSQSKRLKTFNSSQFSLWEQKNKVTHASASDLNLIKPQTMRRAAHNSILTQYTGSKGSTTKINMPSKKKKKPANTKSKSKIKKLDQQQFQKAKYKQSNSQSQIIFSNDETKRQSSISGIQLKNVKHIESIHNYQPQLNKNLVKNIKKDYQRKVEAAIKIQKIYRGYRIRKLLDRIIEEMENEKKIRMKNREDSDFEQIKQNDTYRTFGDMEAENFMKKLWENKAMNDINFNHTIKPRIQDDYNSSEEDQELIEESQKNIMKNFPRHKEDITQKQGRKIRTWMQREEISERAQRNSNSQPQQQEQSQQDSREMYYKRQNPIYSQQQISEYLESSSNQYEQQLNDAYQPDIIFETNEQYIESKKSSLQNKGDIMSKLSNKGLSDIEKLPGSGVDDMIRKQLREDNRQPEEEGRIKRKNEENINKTNEPEVKYQTPQNDNNLKGVQKQKNKLNQSSQSSAFEGIIVNFHDEQKLSQSSQPIPTESVEQKQPKPSIKISNSELSHRQTKEKQVEEKVKPAYSPRRDIKYLQQQFYESNNSNNTSRSHNSNSSKKSLQQQEIIKLREQECEKWEEVIRMVNEQIKRNQQNNGEMINFMQTIMEFSQKNKQLLGSTRSVIQSDAFTTPTSMGAGMFNSNESKNCAKEEKFEKLKQKNQRDKNDDQEDSAFKFFKKKKPLKIDIAEDHHLDGQRQSLFSQISDPKPPKNKIENEKQKQFIRSNHKKQLDFPPISPGHAFKKEPFFNTNERKNIKNELESCFENSKNLKKFLTSNIQVQDSAIYDILKLRQQLLKKRESEELMKLHKELNDSHLTQEQFLEKLSTMTHKFLQQKQVIDKAKQDIVKGYQAANDLVKEYFFDVRRMGIKLAVSRSQDNLKYKFAQPSYFTNEIQIDQLTPKVTPKSGAGKKPSVKQIFQDYEIQEDRSKQKSAGNAHIFQSSEESSMDFTEQQLRRFRKAANYDLQFNDLNRNMTTISDQFIRQQRNVLNDISEPHKQLLESPESSRFNQGIEPHKQMYHLQDQKAPSSRTPPYIQSIIQSLVNIMVWQFSSQLIIRPSISDKFIDRVTFIKPLEITNQQRLDFLKILSENLPEKSSLHRKLNQNITPMPQQILKCMRLDFSEDTEEDENQDNNYEEINKYEFVISQQSCAKSIMLFKNHIDQLQQQKEIEEMRKNNQIISSFEQNIRCSPIAQKIQKFLTQREKFIKNRKQHTRQLRWEVINIELHCIFDSWNEQIIQICSTRPGFSGIGLNQLTLSIKNHNKPIQQNKVQSVIQAAKNQVVQILMDEADINAKILRENFHEMCQTDSAWIFYADEALSYALQLVYLVQQDLYIQIARQFRKIIMKNSLSI